MNEKKALNFFDNIEQKRPLWGIWDQLEIDTENNSQSSENNSQSSENNSQSYWTESGVYQREKIIILLFAVCPHHSTWTLLFCDAQQHNRN